MTRETTHTPGSHTPDTRTPGSRTPDTRTPDTRTPAGHRPVGFTATLGGEWRKFRALPGVRGMLLAAALVTSGISAAIVLYGAGAGAAAVQADNDYEVIFFGATLGVWAFAWVGVSFSAVEFGTGLADHTFVATPRRHRVPAAKLLVLAGTGIVGGAVLSLLNVGITQGVLGAAGYPVLDFADPGLWRAVLLYIGLGMAVQSVLGCLVAVLVRHAFGALVVTLLLNALPVVLAEFFGAGYAAVVPRWVPGAAVESIAGLAQPGSPGYLPLPWAVLDLVLWVGVLGAVALRRLHRTDAR